MEDLPSLADYFLEEMGRESACKVLAPEALLKLHGHDWPGNIRELMHVLERGAILSEDQREIGVDHIRLRMDHRR